MLLFHTTFPVQFLAYRASNVLHIPAGFGTQKRGVSVGRNQGMGELRLLFYEVSNFRHIPARFWKRYICRISDPLFRRSISSSSRVGGLANLPLGVFIYRIFNFAVDTNRRLNSVHQPHIEKDLGLSTAYLI